MIQGLAELPKIAEAAQGATGGTAISFALTLLEAKTQAGDEAVTKLITDKDLVKELFANRDRQNQQAPKPR